MQKKLLFIVNPCSGKGQIKSKIFEILNQMMKLDYEVTVHITQGAKEAIEKTKEEAKNYDLVVCNGGDGTLDEVVTGMMLSEKKVPIGYIPSGSTNDFGNSLKIPKDMLKAAKIAVSGKSMPLDVGYFNGDYFVYIAAFGLFTDVSYQTSQDWKNVLGHAAYILEGAKRLYNIPSYIMKVEYEDTIIEDEFVFGMITNSNSVGGFKNLTGKNVLLNDGLFEVTLIKMPKNPVELNEILGCLANMIDDSNLIYTFKTSSLKISPEKQIPWTLDGEYGGDHMEVDITNMNCALEIMTKHGEIR